MLNSSFNSNSGDTDAANSAREVRKKMFPSLQY